ncbi:MAG: hypothetical protein KDD65_00930 [Bacteroidetes bacterium]|nr:hypothetical protein [Bacteroidota bacterium]
MPDSGHANIDELRTRCDELLDQMEYTADEVSVLRKVIDRVPDQLLSAASPETGQSIKSILGHITVRDVDMLNALTTAEAGTESETDWDGVPIDDLLVRLHDRRQTIVRELRQLSDRADPSTLAALDDRLKRIVAQDVEAFREVASLLHYGGIGTL